ncbi:MAG: 50S ribosomal protein L10 [Alphaproteobacteria bacterium MarineAlpha5_Bin12]|nr:MAG: 50S ribosomal protein L10 [Alphaproteobacteria bacterium MarineAlpha5_Bin12]|tara:strand:- start:25360 stop:25884 length:525 start_codon:yes stop_codon:yes gene_type:complete
MEFNLDRSKKENIVSSLKNDFKESNLLVVTHYSGLNVSELEDLRAKMREVNAKFKVTKNRLTKLALPGTSFENVSELFTGPTAIAYSEDPLVAAKVAVNFSKENKKLIILGGSYEGKLIDDKEVKFLASLPSLDEIRGKLVGVIMAPGSKIASLLQEPASKLVRTFGAYAKKTT